MVGRVKRQLSPIQEGMYFSEQLFGERINLVAGHCFLQWSVEIEKFEASRQNIGRRHSIFKTEFQLEDDGRPVQTLRPFSLNEIDILDLSAVRDSEEAALEWIKGEFLQTIKFNATELFFDQLIKLSPDKYIYCVRAHHLIVDAWSLFLWIGEVCDCYFDVGVTETTSVGSEVPSYFSHLDSYQVYLDSDRYVRDRRYWLHKYEAESVPCFLPKYRVHDEAVFGTESIFISADIVSNINKLGEILETGTLSVLLGVICSYFCSVYSRDRLEIAIPVHNRSTQMDKKIIGPLSNQIVSRFDVDGNASLADVINTVRKNLSQDFRHKKYPYLHLARELGVGAGGKTHVADIVFNYERFQSYRCPNGATLRTYNLGQFSYTPIHFAYCEFDADEGAWLNLDYRKEFISSPEAISILQGIVGLLREIADNIETPVSRLPLLSAEEEHCLLVEWNDTRQSIRRTGVCMSCLRIRLPCRRPRLRLIVMGKS